MSDKFYVNNPSVLYAIAPCIPRNQNTRFKAGVCAPEISSIAKNFMNTFRILKMVLALCNDKTIIISYIYICQELCCIHALFSDSLIRVY